MTQKFFKKFFLTTTSIILVSITAITIILSFFVSSYFTKEKLKVLEEICEAVVTATEKLTGDSVDFIKSPVVFNQLADITEADIFIVDLKGNIVVCGCDDWAVDGLCIHNKNTVSTSVLNKFAKDDYSEYGDLEGFFDKAVFIHSKVLKNESGEKISYVFASLSPANIHDFYKKVLWMLFVSSIVPLIAMIIAEYFVSYRFTKPLRLMAEASRRMAKGDFSKRIPVTGNDEISELAVAFNQMTNSLVKTEDTRRSFVANVSHELKTPMTTIGGFIDGIIDGTIPPEKHNYYLGVVSAEIKRLSRLVQSMLSLSKLESGEMKINATEFSISDMLLEIVVSQEQRIEEKELEILGLDLLENTVVTADKDLIHQVIYNLVDNAVKFTNQKGKISFFIEDNEEFTEFKIQNTGEGIDEKELPFVFDRFYKADKSRSKIKDSTGLGLYIANTIISIHGGKISVRSVKNKFTEFVFTLPKNANQNTNPGYK